MGQEAARPEILSGWKEIANYMGKAVRTVQRYEREMGLPVRRPAGKYIGSVIATKAEIDAWIAASPVREGFHLTRVALDSVPLMKQLRFNVDRLAQLKKQSEELQKELASSLQMLRQNLVFAVSEKDRPRQLPTNVRADVLMFDAKKKAN